MALLYANIRSQNGTVYTVTNTIKDTADNPVVVPAYVRAADGSTTYIIFVAVAAVVPKPNGILLIRINRTTKVTTPSRFVKLQLN